MSGIGLLEGKEEDTVGEEEEAEAEEAGEAEGEVGEERVCLKSMDSGDTN